jgi:hypothetical protein
VRHELRGTHTGHVGRRRILTGFGVVFVLILGLSALGIAIGKPKPAKPHCPPATKLCGRPPVLAAPLTSGVLWRSPALGFSLEYSGDAWRVGGENGTTLQLNSTHGDLTLIVSGTKGTPADLPAILASRVSDLSGRTLGLAPDHDPRHAVLGPAVGYRPGVGATYAGTIDLPQGPQSPITAALIAASDGRVAITVTAATTEIQGGLRTGLLSTADSVVNTVAWGSG